jgi:hypothetical protein
MLGQQRRRVEAAPPATSRGVLRGKKPPILPFGAPIPCGPTTMAVMRRVKEIVVDDLTGEETEAGVRVRLSLDGRAVELDLSPVSHERLVDLLEPWLNAGQPVRAAGPRSRPRNPEAVEARAWARARGYDVPDRGRLNRSVLEAYRSARA